MRYLLPLPILLLLLYWGGPKSAPDPVVIASDTIFYQLPDSTELPEIVYQDTLLDRLARFVGGLQQQDSNNYHTLEHSEHWREYQNTMDENWTRMNDSRLSLMENWKNEHLMPRINESRSLFYPFGGPDFLHAAVFYSNTNEFILAGLEPITEVPDLTKLDSIEQNRFLDSLSASLRDVFGKSFFITRNMKKDLKQVNGVVPLFLVFIARTGHELVNLNYVSVDSAGNDFDLPFSQLSSQKTRGVRIEFRRRGGGQLRKLYYFSGDASNPGLKSKKNLLKFLSKRQPYNTYIKSASYLMHQDMFSDIRNVILAGSESIFEDDTGIPYRFLKGGQFDSFLFGEYQKPVKDFLWLEMQQDLDSAFQLKSQPLPFSLGYHWSDRKQHYMLFKKKNSIFAQ